MDEQRVRVLVASLRREVEAAAVSKEPQKGMRVPYHGAFANATPSVIRDVRWYVRELESALGADPGVQP